MLCLTWALDSFVQRCKKVVINKVANKTSLWSYFQKMSLLSILILICANNNSYFCQLKKLQKDKFVRLVINFKKFVRTSRTCISCRSKTKIFFQSNQRTACETAVKFSNSSFCVKNFRGFFGVHFWPKYAKSQQRNCAIAFTWNFVLTFSRECKGRRIGPFLPFSNTCLVKLG
jgi:hypothetical protein